MNSTVEATLNFLIPDGSKPVVYPSKGGGPPERRTAKYESRAILVTDGRSMDEEFSLDLNGFQLVAQNTAALHTTSHSVGEEFGHDQLDLPVVEEHPVAGLDVFG